MKMQSQPSFIIVDDEPDMCWALENLLRQEGFATQKAESGQEALRLIESRRFKVAFLDVKLPDIDGIELAHRIKSVDATIDIVIVSGYYYQEDEPVQEALKQGLICAFVAKPYFHSDIVDLLRSLCP
ncbi:MAG: response regulator [Deltaproteobacteria bacterium]